MQFDYVIRLKEEWVLTAEVCCKPVNFKKVSDFWKNLKQPSEQ